MAAYWFMGFHKRGMSPLIATVLLMAFAVALGGMIMRISTDPSDPTKECGEVRLLEERFCYVPDKSLRVELRNVGPIPVKALHMEIAAPDADPFRTVIPDSTLDTNDRIRANPALRLVSNTSVALFVELGESPNSQICELPTIERAPLDRCS